MTLNEFLFLLRKAIIALFVEVCYSLKIEKVLRKIEFTICSYRLQYPFYIGKNYQHMITNGKCQLCGKEFKCSPMKK